VAGQVSCDLKVWSAWLEEDGFFVQQSSTPDSLASRSTGFDALFLGLYSTNSTRWFALAKHLRDRNPSVKITVLAVEGSEDLAIQALHAHVHDYLRGPITQSALVAAARLATRKVGRAEPDDEPGILGGSASITALRTRLERLAASDCNVLITGESGTGKELAAAAIHRQSSRNTGRLVCVNCAAMPDTLIESELFGRERGAFTGADTSQDGKLKAADGGVIFLDEVGDLSLYAQAKILRAVETREIYRLGSNRPVSVNARIIAATHRDLEDMVRQGQFRQDLFFRLNVGRVYVLPLRERMEDLRLLVDYYLMRLNRRLGTSIDLLSEEVWQALTRHTWPGNVRELKNLLESAMVNSSGSTITMDDLPLQLCSCLSIPGQPGERVTMLEALHAMNWNKSKAAEKLKWSRMKLYRKMAKYSVRSDGDHAASA
jgi:DNA-binding NtrC family response regulator